MFSIEHTKAFGRGLFATRDIEAGEIIIEEKASFVLDFPKNSFYCERAEEYCTDPANLETHITHLRSFSGGKATHGRDGAILFRNGFCVVDKSGDETDIPQKRILHFFPTICLVNHNCIHNCNMNIISLGSIAQLVCVRKIHAGINSICISVFTFRFQGEQIFIDYFFTTRNLKEKHNYLSKNLGIICNVGLIF